MNGGKTCTFQGCSEVHEARGLCRGHYTQFKRGKVLTVLRKKKPVSDSHFWRNVDKKSDAECWNWTGFVHPTGYGRCGGGRFGARSAHKYSYILAFGAVPEGMVIDHACHNRKCVNPNHLRAVTNKQNMENLGALHASNTSGARGVREMSNGTFQARVRHNGKLHHFGTYQSFAEAEAAALRGRLQLFTHNDKDRERIYRSALVAIQELHQPVKGWISEREYLMYCSDCGDATYPCKTRKLADEGLTDRMARTNQGENND